MSIVAVAGGTGGIGKTIVKGFKGTQHKVIVLSRKIPSESDKEEGIEYIKVDYDDIDGTARMLEESNVDTVISAINLLLGLGNQSQYNLIAAAEKSKPTTKFFPSEWSHMAQPEEAEYDPMVAGLFQSAAMLRASPTLRYTRVINGFIMDYWGMPNITSSMHNFRWGIDVEHRMARIPGSGNDKMTLTMAEDVAQAVVRLLDVEDWPEYSKLAGSDITFNEMLAAAERITGEKFDVKYDSQEALEKNEASVLPQPPGAGFDDETIQTLSSLFGRSTTSGSLHVPEDGRLHERFPDFKPTTFEQLLVEAWGSESAKN